MKFINLASSSDGNCTYISDEKYNILIDCGITYKQIKERLEKINVSIDNIDAIFLTHGHIDHIRGLDNFMRNHLKTYIFGYFDTFLYIDKKYPCKYDYERFYNIDINNTFSLKNILGSNCKINITPYLCPHDAPCVFYKINIDNTELAILTDCGYYDKNIINILKNINYIMLESNYDEELIENSIYPKYLIERIKGKGGHLSNKNCSDLILEINNPNLKTICLSHISHNSNDEDTALTFVKNYIKKYINDNENMPNLITASRTMPTIIIDN